MAESQPAPGASTPDQPPAKADAAWLSQGERGALWSIRLMFRLAKLLGRWPTRQFVRLIAWYYATFDANAAKASRAWLERVHGREVTKREVRAHVFRFAQVALDRISMVRPIADVYTGRARTSWQHKPIALQSQG